MADSPQILPVAEAQPAALVRPIVWAGPGELSDSIFARVLNPKSSALSTTWLRGFISGVLVTLLLGLTGLGIQRTLNMPIEPRMHMNVAAVSSKPNAVTRAEPAAPRPRAPAKKRRVAKKTVEPSTSAVAPRP